MREMREKIRSMTDAFERYHTALHRRAPDSNTVEVARLDYETAFLEAVATIVGPKTRVVPICPAKKVSSSVNPYDLVGVRRAAEKVRR